MRSEKTPGTNSLIYVYHNRNYMAPAPLTLTKDRFTRGRGGKEFVFVEKESAVLANFFKKECPKAFI